MILVNGCSYTYGDELEDPSSQRWSTHLEEILGTKVLNIARPGSSNSKIFRDTCNTLMTEKGITGCLVMWSAFERVEFINIGLEHNYNKNAELINEPFVQMSPSRIVKENRSIKGQEDAWETFYGRIYTSETGIVNTVNYMCWINWICSLINIDCAQIQFHEGNRNLFNRSFSRSRQDTIGPRLIRIAKPCGEKVNKLPAASKIGFSERFKTFNEFTTENKFRRMPEGHPGPEAHLHYARYLGSVFSELKVFNGV